MVSNMEFKHYSVMLEESLDLLDIKKDGVYVDCTLGGAGHTKRLLQRLGEGGKVIGIDRDADAIENASLTVNDGRFVAVHSNFGRLEEILDELGVEEIDGVIMDLGVSSYQLDTEERGFSYSTDAPLDMRMDRGQKLDASEVLNAYSVSELKRVFYEYGEERYSGRIAERIVEAREKEAIGTTGRLFEIVSNAVHGSKADKLSSVKRIFQAVRIEVNGELEVISTAIESAVRRLKKGGRISVISFHSLEDRIVKQSFASLAKGCDCPRDIPVCVCGKTPVIKLVTRKPVLPTEKELAENSRSHSAKLRAAEKL